MDSLAEATDRAVRLGRRASGRGRRWTLGMAVGPSGPGGATGRLALEAFREFGEDGMRAVMTGYGAGYNRRTLEPATGQEGAA